MITEWAGKDASKEYESIGHSGDASRDLKSFRIGVIGSSKKVEKNSPCIEDQIPVKKNKSDSGKRKRRPYLLFCA